MKMLWLLILKRLNEKIHNRSKSRVVAAAGDHSPGIKDHEQRMDQTWPADPDQWLQAGSPKPSRTKTQGPSSKPQASQYGQIHLI